MTENEAGSHFLQSSPHGPGGLTVNELARLWDVPPATVRRFLRRYHPEMQTKYGRWFLTIETARELKPEIEQHVRKFQLVTA